MNELRELKLISSFSMFNLVPNDIIGCLESARGSWKRCGWSTASLVVLAVYLLFLLMCVHVAEFPSKSGLIVWYISFQAGLPFWQDSQ